MGRDAMGNGTPLNTAVTIWFWLGIFASVVYWIARVVRRAWREGTPPAPTQTESGRIFGRLW
jgi:hypothetical protein